MLVKANNRYMPNVADRTRYTEFGNADNALCFVVNVLFVFEVFKPFVNLYKMPG